jgi:hypothetical protein
MLGNSIINLNKFAIAIVLAASLMFCSAQQEVPTASVKILIPLYSYPTWYNPSTYTWSEIAAAASKVPIAAIINPNNGPDGGPPNQDYARGLEDLRQAGVTILGYVFTQYGDRPIGEVKQDIALYNDYYNINGIFLDEAASSADQLDYYRDIYEYIKTKTNLDLVILNPGTQIEQDYLARPAADIAVIFEDNSQAWIKYQPQSYLSSYEPGHFASLIHSVPDAATMKSHIDRAVARQIGYIYVTDDSPTSPDRDPWNSLPSYWQEEIDYIQSLNQGLERSSVSLN